MLVQKKLKSVEFEVIDDALEEEDHEFRQKKSKTFMTREISRFYDRDTFLRTSLREMLIYFGFIFTLGVLTNTTITTVQYFYSRALVGIFVETKFNSRTGEIINFQGIHSIDHIWPFIEENLLDNLYWTFWYSTDQSNTDLLPEDSHIIYSNKLIGLPRVRQVRVMNDSCEVPDDFKLMFTACYAEYSRSTEDTGKFGLETPTAWTYTSKGSLGSHNYVGEISTYGGGGYYIDLADSKNESLLIINDLKTNLWLDRATRAVFIDFAIYNGNINYFCFVKLALELPPTGGVLPFYEFQTVRFTWKHNVWIYVQLICQIVFVIYCLLHSAEEIYEMIYFKWYYITTFWNWLDLTLLLLSWTVIILYIVRYAEVSSNLKQLIQMENSHPVFDDLLFLEYSYSTALALLLFLSWVKFIKYLALNHSMYQMQSTLARASTDIACFSVIFFTVFIAFAQLGNLLFGSQVKEFRSFNKAIFALLRTVVGDFHYQELENANHMLGPIYFFSYIFFIFFILVNMFLAIIIDTYSEVRTELQTAGIKTHVGDIICRHFNNLLRLIGLKELADSRERSAAKESGRATYQEIRNLLQRCGFFEQDIDLFFAKYGITEDRLISPDEMRKILSNVDELPPVQVDSHTVPIIQDFELASAKLGERINVLGDATVATNYKLDIILNKLYGLQQMKMARSAST